LYRVGGLVATGPPSASRVPCSVPAGGACRRQESAAGLNPRDRQTERHAFLGHWRSAKAEHVSMARALTPYSRQFRTLLPDFASYRSYLAPDWDPRRAAAAPVGCLSACRAAFATYPPLRSRLPAHPPHLSCEGQPHIGPAPAHYEKQPTWRESILATFVAVRLRTESGWARYGDLTSTRSGVAHHSHLARLARLKTLTILTSPFSLLSPFRIPPSRLARIFPCAATVPLEAYCTNQPRQTPVRSPAVTRPYPRPSRSATDRRR
jgi:hypothetical protein